MNYSHIEDVHILFGAYLKIFSYFLRVLNLDIFPSQMRRGCLVCVIYNYNSFHSFTIKLCMMIVHTLRKAKLPTVIGLTTKHAIH